MRHLPRTLRATTPGITARVQFQRPLFLRPAPFRQSSWKAATAAAGVFYQKPTCNANPSHVLEASSSAFGLVAAASLALGATFYYYIVQKPSPHISDSTVLSKTVPCFGESSQPLSENTPNTADTADTTVAEVTGKMGFELPPGRIGNLTPEQEEKLRQLWLAISRVCQFDMSSLESGDGADAADADDGAGAEVLEPITSVATGDSKKKDKKKKRSLFKRSKKDGNPTEEPVAAVTKAVGAVDLAAASEDDKYGQSKLFQDALASQSPESIRDTIWSMVKHDHPDALVLRFLRARKWDVDKALVMLVSTMHWRAQDMHVDDDIMKKGEGGAAEELTTSTDEKAKTVSEDFLSQMRMGKSFIHGSDKQGRPICIVRVRLHHQGDQVEESVERCTVYTIETARMTLRPPVDTAVSTYIETFRIYVGGRALMHIYHTRPLFLT